MFQPQATPYLHVSTGYAIPQGLNYNFEPTPLGLSYDRRSAAPGASGNSAASALLYGSPLFSGAPNSCSPGVGPAPPVSAPYPFHTPTTATPPTATTATSSTAPTSATTAHHQPPLSGLLKMDPADLQAQYEAAQTHEPVPEGPLVGKKTLSTAITDEYAKADPVYVEKTLALPRTYSHYRPILGDGNCGWRAIAFGYFETLAKMGNQVTLDAEKQRLLGLNTLIEQVGGFPSDVYVDFVEETFALLDKLSGLVGHTEQAISVLEEAFNDASISNSIMYHLRMLATAYLKGHRDQYAAFLEMEGGVDVYCDRVLNRHGVEIDHLGIVLLSNVLLKDAGFVLEIAYLDRSPGSEVNKYRFPEEANARQPPELGPVIYLLFRPDHYDILYVPEPEPVNIQVHRVDTFTQPFQIGSAPIPMQGFGAINMQTLSMIPGIGSIGMQPSPLSGILDPTPSPLAYNQAPVSTTPWMQTPYVDPLTQAAPPPPPMPMPAAAPAASSVQQLHPVRFSEWCLRNNATDKNWRREQTLQTSTFKNSHFNTAHFNNPDFQPEEYKPEQDERNTPPRGGGKKRGSV